MSVSLNHQRTTLRQTIERAAGMHPAPAAGTTALLFSACESGAHGRCHERAMMGASEYRCSCQCHNGIDPADFDNAYGEPWWAEQAEAE